MTTIDVNLQKDMFKLSLVSLLVMIVIHFTMMKREIVVNSI